MQRYLLIGTLLLALLGGIAYYTLFREKPFTVYLLFDHAEGLKEKTEVRANGIVVGEVKEVRLWKNKVLAKIVLKQPGLSRSAVFVLRHFGLFQPDALILTENTAVKESLRSGDTLAGQLNQGHPSDQHPGLVDTASARLLKPYADSISAAIKSIEKSLKEK